MENQTHPNARRTEAKREAEKAKLIEALHTSPIIQIACQIAGIQSRSSYYRWRREDSEFAAACDVAIAEGVELVSDLAESRLIQSIKDNDFRAVSFWLRNRHAAYAEKLRIEAKVESVDKPLTPEQEATIRRAVELARIPKQYDQSAPPDPSDAG